jgi:hypothetical protein
MLVAFADPRFVPYISIRCCYYTKWFIDVKTPFLGEVGESGKKALFSFSSPNNLPNNLHKNCAGACRTVTMACA